MKTCYYEIGGHSLAVCFVNEENSDDLIPSFAPFRLQEEPAELLFTMLVDDNLDWPEQNDEIGQFDCGGCNHGVYRRDDGGYLYSIHDIHDVLCSRMQSNADFSECCVSLYGKTWVQRNYGLNNALMMAYAFASACSATMLMHASVIRQGGKGYLMTAPSGTGKSTHSRLWLNHIPDTELLNDDNPVIRVFDSKALVYGTPWSGKTPCYKNMQVPLKAVVRLSQAPYNKIARLAPLQAFASLMPACSCKRWDNEAMSLLHKSVEKTITMVPCYHLECLPDEAAAMVCYNAVLAE